MDKIQVNPLILKMEDYSQLNRKSFILEKIIINEVPKLKDDNDKKPSKPTDNKNEGFRPYIQIFKESKAIFNYLSKYSTYEHFLINNKGKSQKFIIQLILQYGLMLEQKLRMIY